MANDTLADNIIQPDEQQARASAESDLEDEANDVGDDSSSLTSITTSILKGRIGEGGRTYATYGKEEYGMPMDDRELDRIDMCHAKYYALLEKERFLAPIDESPQKILDLGCGTGIWCIDVADEYPSAEVIGTDIAPTQPEWVPPNCRFELDDIERPWTWQENSFDFIFSRDLITVVRDWPKLIDQCYNHLKPGGWVEFHAITASIGCDDGTLPPDSYLKRFADYLGEAGEKFGTPVDDPVRWKQWFEDRGFEQVTQKIAKLPCNPWPKDKRLKLLGAWEMENLLTGLEGMTLRLFHKGLGWSEEDTQLFFVPLRKDFKKLQYHAYWPFYVVYGRKPLPKGESSQAA